MPDPDPLPDAEPATASGVGSGAGTDPSTPARYPAAHLRDGAEFGRYRLVRRLGEGGMGVVWLARDAELQRDVALKQIKAGCAADETQMARFVREARLAARLRHPHLVGVYDVGCIDGVYFISMEYVQGRTFAEFLRERAEAKRAERSAGLDRLRDEVRILAEVADAVACAHLEGIIHRDLKPSNVLLDAAESPFVMDFGLAKEFSAASFGARNDPLTLSDQVLGTPAYMSPEQARSETPRIGPPSDVWALGVMLYEMLAGERPFSGDQPVQMLVNVMNVDPRPPQLVNRLAPRELSAVCLKALEKNPYDRYPHARAFAEELRRWLGGEPVLARHPGAAMRTWRWAVRRKTVVAPVAGLLLIAAGLGIWGWRSRTAEAEARALAEAEKQRATDQRRAFLEKIRAAALTYEDTVMRHELDAEVKRKFAGQPLALIDELIQLEPEYGVTYAWRGMVRALAGMAGEAETDYDRGCALAPDSAVVWYLRGVHRLEKYERSRELPARTWSPGSVRRDPPLPEDDAAKALREQGLADLTRMVAASARDPLIGEELVRLGKAAARLRAGGDGDYEACLTLLQGMSSPKALRQRGLALYLLGRFPEAFEALAGAAKEWPGDGLARRFLGKTAYALGQAETMAGRDGGVQFRTAIAELDAAIRIDPAFAYLYNDRGCSFDALGDQQVGNPAEAREDYVRAIREFDEAIRRDAGAFMAYNNRGLAREDLAAMQKKRGENAGATLAQAIADYDEAIRLNPEYAEAYSNRGLVREQTAAGLAPALADFDQALRLHPGEPSFLCNRAETRARLAEGRVAGGADPRVAFAEALADIDEALRLNPDFPVGYLQRALIRRSLAEALFEKGVDPSREYEQVLADFAESVRRRDGRYVRSESAITYMSIASYPSYRSRDSRELFRRAIADLDAALRFDPEYTQGYEYRGLAYGYLSVGQAAMKEDSGDSEARMFADLDEFVRRKQGQGLAHYKRGSSFLKIGDARRLRDLDPQEWYRKGEADLRTAIAKGYAPGHGTLGSLYRVLGRLDDAIAEYKALAEADPQYREESESQIREIEKDRK